MQAKIEKSSSQEQSNGLAHTIGAITENQKNKLYINGLGEITDARSCTVQGPRGFLYLDAAPAKAQALLGYQSLLVSETNQAKMQKVLSSLNENYTCVVMTRDSDEALETAEKLAGAIDSTKPIEVINVAEDHFSGAPSADKTGSTTGNTLIADERSTFARCANWFGCITWDTLPAFIVVGESIAAGRPFGAVFAHRNLGLPQQSNTVSEESLAQVQTVINALTQSHATSETAALGNYLLEKLRSLRSTCPQPMKISAIGLNAQITFETPELTKEVLIGMRERGILLATDGKCSLSIFPPLTIRAAEIDAIAGSLRAQLMGWPMSLPAPCCGDHDHHDH